MQGDRFRDPLSTSDDAALRAPWALLRGGHVLFTLPRMAALRWFVLNHLVHHRSPHSVYLRLLDVPVSSAYGPSADERE